MFWRDVYFKTASYKVDEARRRCARPAPTRRYWRHEVPKDRHVRPHPAAGDGRLNLTFRMRADTTSAAARARDFR